MPLPMRWDAESTTVLMLQVPPMPAAEALAVLQAELLGQPLDEVFAWINLDTPLGSASIAQVGLLKAVGSNLFGCSSLSLPEALLKLPVLVPMESLSRLVKS